MRMNKLHRLILMKKYITTDTKNSTSEEIDDKHNGEKEVIAKKTLNLWRWKMNDYRGGEDVASVKEVEMRLNTVSVYGNNALVNGFDASTFSGENIYDIFENENEIVTEDSII